MTMKLMWLMAGLVTIIGCPLTKEPATKPREIVKRPNPPPGAHDSLILWSNRNPDTLIVQGLVPDSCLRVVPPPECADRTAISMDTVRKP